MAPVNPRKPNHIHEILERAAAAKSVPDRAKILQAHNCLGLRDVLNGAFNDAVTWDLPEGSPPYQANQSNEGIYPTDLRRETSQLRYLVKHPINAKVLRPKKERIFIQLLEGIHPKDAEVLIAMKDKTLHTLFKGLTKAVVQKAFPGLGIK